MLKIIETYINGNLKDALEMLNNSSHSFGDLYEYYIEEFKPDLYETTLFVKRMGV